MTLPRLVLALAALGAGLRAGPPEVSAALVGPATAATSTSDIPWAGAATGRVATPKACSVAAARNSGSAATALKPISAATALKPISAATALKAATAGSGVASGGNAAAGAAGPRPPVAGNDGRSGALAPLAPLDRPPLGLCDGS